MEKEGDMKMFGQFAYHVMIVICADIVVHFGWLFAVGGHVTV